MTTTMAMKTMTRWTMTMVLTTMTRRRRRTTTMEEDDDDDDDDETRRRRRRTRRRGLLLRFIPLLNKRVSYLYIRSWVRAKDRERASLIKRSIIIIIMYMMSDYDDVSIRLSLSKRDYLYARML